MRSKPNTVSSQESVSGGPLDAAGAIVCTVCVRWVFHAEAWPRVIELSKMIMPCTLFGTASTNGSERSYLRESNLLRPGCLPTLQQLPRVHVRRVSDGVSCFRGRNPSAARWTEASLSLDWFSKIQIHGIEYCRENVYEGCVSNVCRRSRPSDHA